MRSDHGIHTAVTNGYFKVELWKQTIVGFC